MRVRLSNYYDLFEKMMKELENKLVTIEDKKVIIKNIIETLDKMLIDGEFD